jgi:prepilin-type N-terminal cleavage/methylation domain-containing protein
MKIKLPIADCRLPVEKKSGACAFFQIANRKLKIANGFTLLEVMIAVMALATATFAILALVSQSLQNARLLQRPMIDVGPIDAQLCMTNKFVEGTTSGELGDLLGDSYRGYNYSVDIVEEQTNKLFHADVIIQRDDDKSIIAQERLLYYKPQSPAGSLDGATVGGGR